MKPKCISGRQSIAFWSWLQEHEEEIHALAKANTGAALERLGRQFRKTYRELAFELGGSEHEEKIQLYVSACGDKQHFPLVVDVVNNAPVFQKFDVLPFRQRKPLSLMQDAKLCIEGLTLCAEDVFFTAEQTNNQLYVTLYMENYDGSDIYNCCGCVLMECFLGEHDFAEYVGGLRFVKLEKKHLFNVDPLWKLPHLVDSKLK